MAARALRLRSRDDAVQPALTPPPPGTSPSFDNPPGRDPLIYGVSITAIVISVLLVGLHTYTRVAVNRKVDFEDYFLWLGSALSVVYLLMQPYDIPLGSGLHQDDVSPQRLSLFLQRANWVDVLYSPSICFVKLSILFQLKNLFAPLRNRLYWGIVALAGVTGAFYLSSMLFRIFQCVPREKIWNQTVPGHCIDSAAGIVSSAILNIIDDFVILCVPLVQIWRLQLNTRTKVAVSVVFLTGLLGCAASIMRLYASVKIFSTGEVVYYIVDVGLWCGAEIAASIICCCLPVLPQLWRKVLAPWARSLRTRTLRITSKAHKQQSNLAVSGLGNGNHTYIELADQRSTRPQWNQSADGDNAGIRKTTTVTIQSQPKG